jgi:hypothetical protein
MEFHIFNIHSSSTWSKLARCLVICSLVTAVAMAPAFAEPAGTVKTSKGTATIDRKGQKIPVAAGTSVEVGDRVLTGVDGAVGIVLRDNTALSAGPNSTLDLNKFSFDSTTHAGELDATVKRGTLAVISGKVAKANPNGVRFATQSMTLGVRGTEFVIEAGEEE